MMQERQQLLIQLSLAIDYSLKGFGGCDIWRNDLIKSSPWREIKRLYDEIKKSDSEYIYLSRASGEFDSTGSKRCDETAKALLLTVVDLSVHDTSNCRSRPPFFFLLFK